ERRRFSQKIAFLLDPGQFALQAGHLLVPGRPGTAEGNGALALGLPLPAGQQRVADPQFPGDLGTADAPLACLFNCATLELRTELPSLRHEHSSWPRSALS